MTPEQMIGTLERLRAHCDYISWEKQRQQARADFDAAIAAFRDLPSSSCFDAPGMGLTHVYLNGAEWCQCGAVSRVESRP